MQSIFDKATTWTSAGTPQIQLDSELYCATRDVFGVRLEGLLGRLEKQINQNAYILTAIIGEIGNNSFDHNLGNWPDIPGVFFTNDQEKNIIVLADRGQGVRKTLTRVKPNISSDQEALVVAFTETLSGRAPEKRGNGLKFVADVIKEQNWSLTFQSGDATIVHSNGKFSTTLSDVTVRGTLAILTY